MEKITLSYVITTRNKLPFLTYGLNRLIKNLKSDEEIIIVDAGSSDGTVEFLTSLYQKKIIHQFVTEPDFGEGHGFNKGFLLAKGDLIKIITDDDFFNYPAIQECKILMLKNKDIDVMIGNIYDTPIDNFEKIQLESMVENNFKNYVETGQVFPFTGLSLMIRKSSMALTGFFYSNIVCVDTEFALRITEIGVNIAWTDAAVAVRIGNPQSKLGNMNEKKYTVDLDRFQYFYNHEYRKRINNLLLTILRKFKTLFKNTKKLFKVSSNQGSDLKNIYCTIEHIESVNKKCGEYILNLNKEKSNFIFSK
jgi:glycosyltransferase involved in cell wall biosynthesis